MFDSSKVGYSFPSFTVTVEYVKLCELTQAIGDSNPLYQCQQRGQETGYADISFLPTAGTIFLFWGNQHFPDQLAELGLDVTRLMHREEEYEYLAPIHCGERLTGVMTVLDGSNRRGPYGTSIDLVTLRLCYTSQAGQSVLVAKTRLVSRE